MKMVRLLIGIALVAILAAEGCGRGEQPLQSAAGATPPPTPTDPKLAAIVASNTQRPVWTPAPPAPGEKVYLGFGIRTLPAPSNLVPKISLTQAAASTDIAAFVAQGLAPGVPDSELRLVTTGDVSPEGKVPNALTKQPGWVITYHNSPVIKGGPPGADTQNRWAGLLCDFTVMIDAETGQMIAGLQDC